MAINNLEALRAKHQASLKKPQGGESFGDNFLKIEAGTTTVRILPWKDDSAAFYAETAIHRITDEQSLTKNYHCGKIFGNACPICDAYKALYAKHNQEKGRNSKEDTQYSKLAKLIKGRQRVYMNAAVRPSNEVKILSVGEKVWQKVLIGIFGDAAGQDALGDVTKVVDGYDLKIIMAVVGGFNNYDQTTFRPKPTLLAEGKELDIIMGSLHDIHALIKETPYEDLKMVSAALMSSVGLLPVTPSAVKTVSSDGETDYLKNLGV